MKIIKKIKKIINKITLFLESNYSSYIRYLDGNFGRSARYTFYKKRLKALGENVIIDMGVLDYFLKKTV